MAKPKLLDPDVQYDHHYLYDWDRHNDMNGTGRSVMAREVARRITWWREEIELETVKAEREEHLRRLWAKGLTGAAVGLLLDTTRRAVLGKAGRLGLLGNRPKGRRRKNGATERLVEAPHDNQRSPYLPG